MHWRLRRLAETARQVAWQSFSRRVLPVRIDGGIVSFTFDDVPESAISAGSKVLEKHGASGTFYLAGGLADTNGETEPFFHAESVAELIARGHEVGCHTFSHRRVSDIPGAAAVEECERNRQWMAAIAPDYSLCSFAYPEGAVSVAAKRALGDRFVTCRWNQDGINVGNVDMTSRTRRRAMAVPRPTWKRSWCMRPRAARRY
jgi:peptidoglycan/xylan/chitin deacetylase (PgdA/CDA1 family)